MNIEGILPAGEQHEVFTTWAKERGVKINAVGPARICGRGLGIVATRKIKVPVHSRLERRSARLIASVARRTARQCTSACSTDYRFCTD